MVRLADHMGLVDIGLDRDFGHMMPADIGLDGDFARMAEHNLIDCWVELAIGSWVGYSLNFFSNR